MDLESSTGSHRTDKTIEVPAPTAWPMMLAFGVALVFAGLATSEMLSGLGAVLALAGVVGWLKDVLPAPAHERVALLGGDSVVTTRRREIERLGVAGDIVRARLPIEFYPVSAGVRGGLAGGVAMAVLAALYGLLSGHGVWYPVNLLAAGFFPSAAAASTAELSAFRPSAFAIAVAIHLTTSLLVGVLYGAMLPMLSRRPILLGGVVAPLLWSGLLHSCLALINPVLAARIDWKWFVFSQLGFGLVAGLVVSRRQRVSTFQSLPFSMRAGIDATRVVDRPPTNGRQHE